MVRAKMYCQAVLDNELTMECIYAPESKEDQRFMQATPWGTLKMGIDNPKALAQFEVGKVYYVDFTKVE